MALRENEMAAACMGVSRARARLAAFALGAFFAGIGGALWAHLLTNLTPGSFDLALAFLLVVMVVVGGSGSLVGALVAAAALVLLRELLRPVEQAAGAYGLVQIIIAVLLIATLVLRPQGLFGSGEPRILRPVARGPQSWGRQSWGRSAPTDRRNRPAANPAEHETGG
jgi:branched-chain amino acid transport system permease protein